MQKDRGSTCKDSAFRWVVTVSQPIGFGKFLFCAPPKNVFRDFAFGFSSSFINYASFIFKKNLMKCNFYAVKM